jgi:predicted nucleic acid-binding protein
MIVLDTNVISETIKLKPHPGVIRWLDEQAAETLFLSSITVAELMFGVGALEDGKRKDALIAAVQKVIGAFDDRVLPFDSVAARRYADLAVKTRRTGHNLPIPDGYIAAIADVKGFAIATRDTNAFRIDGMTVINPWNHAG